MSPYDKVEGILKSFTSSLFLKFLLLIALYFVFLSIYEDKNFLSTPFIGTSLVAIYSFRRVLFNEIGSSVNKIVHSKKTNDEEIGAFILTETIKTFLGILIILFIFWSFLSLVTNSLCAYLGVLSNKVCTSPVFDYEPDIEDLRRW